MKNVKHFYAKDRAAWRKWLEQNHDKESSVWLVYDKGLARNMSWEDIVQESLCFGWVDSTAGKFSDTQSKIYISRRRLNSAWSKINKAHVDNLIKTGLMKPAGMATIEHAKANGAWDILNRSDNMEIPKQLQTLLDKNPEAKKNFTAFSDSAKRIILAWIYSAKREETMLSRINKTVEMAAKNQKTH